jgi:hypothetical protein
MTRNVPLSYKARGSASFSALFNKCKHSAKKRNLDFSLSTDEHKTLISQLCHYCGEPPIKYNSYLKNGGLCQVRPNRYGALTIERNWVEANGIDRINNNEGYTIDNCVPCCGRCNYLKCDTSYDEFLSWISKAYNHLFAHDLKLDKKTEVLEYQSVPYAKV